MLAPDATADPAMLMTEAILVLDPVSIGRAIGGSINILGPVWCCFFDPVVKRSFPVTCTLTWIMPPCALYGVKCIDPVSLDVFSAPGV